MTDEVDELYNDRDGSILAISAHPDEMRPPDGAFLLVLAGDEPIGCGGLKRLDATTCEIKRMYVDPAWRGRGLSPCAPRRTGGPRARAGLSRSPVSTRGIASPPPGACTRAPGTARSPTTTGTRWPGTGSRGSCDRAGRAPSRHERRRARTRAAGPARLGGGSRWAAAGGGIGGRLVAAMSTASGATIADPFARTAHLVAALRVQAAGRRMEKTWTPSARPLPAT